MNTKELVTKWFNVWETGDFQEMPVAEAFVHTSPYGTVEGKAAYFQLIEANQDKFLGNTIQIHDELYEEDKCCVRYTVSKGDFSMEVSEWIYVNEGLIQEIIAYYNIEGEISEDRRLENL